MSFRVTSHSSLSHARTGTLVTNHGVLETPFFMPIATRGAVKAVGVDDLESIGATIILGNTYHLMLQPGTELLSAAGGLHGFMGWSKPILTDSGGYQVFSLTKFRKLSEQGVVFKSPRDGNTHELSPERSMEVQSALGSDIVMAFDECTEYPVSETRARASMELTSRWALRGKEHYRAIGGTGLLFGIVQGSTYRTLRETSAHDLLGIGFDGYAIGGLSIGEERSESYDLVSALDGILPKDRPRYFMGAGQPEEIVEYVRRGVDMFDCVLPTRNARHGLLYRFTDAARIASSPFEVKSFFETLHVKSELFANDLAPIDSACCCFTCQHHTRAYVRYLLRIDEPLGARLASIHNLAFYLELMRYIRTGIAKGVL